MNNFKNRRTVITVALTVSGAFVIWVGCVGIYRTLLSYGRVDLGLFMTYLIVAVVCLAAGAAMTVQGVNVAKFLEEARMVDQTSKDE